MIYLKLFQIFGLIIVGVLLVTQVLIPVIKGTKTWPMFDKKRSGILQEIQETKDELDIQRLENELTQLKEKTKEQHND